MAAGVGHEINNPLTCMLIGVDVLKDKVAELRKEAASENGSRLLADAESLLEELRTGAQRIRDVVGVLRSISCPPEASAASVDLARVIETSIDIASPEIGHRARVKKVVIGELPLLRGDETRLGQVFANLLVNAAQALPLGEVEAKEISVATRLESDRVAIEIGDTGCKISPAAPQKIFEPFFITKDLATGASLRLAICQNIVHEHGGHIEVKSAPGKGSLFRVWLPLRLGDAAEPSASSAPAIEVAGQSPVRVLVIDDDLPSTRRR
jgi:signal transduction histidine kinase